MVVNWVWGWRCDGSGALELQSLWQWSPFSAHSFWKWKSILTWAKAEPMMALR
ncbi:hypothetical protein SLEP1_g37302 [Rubroshorea leprosula]|uniref:Uncharacterized protein n=1 Tax=Rubroshorea leprosula TaxID=152421 RepID=A0AAV5KU89_9ROSI|nr:hypothetical protein SLEP1_g37302 [Rubroshorea leprosula]